MQTYAGIGSRSTPVYIRHLMTEIAESLQEKGYTLRSGGAMGADTAFELGAGNKKEIFLAKDATTRAIALASFHHPAWERCNDYVRKLHGRNMMILFGRDLDSPVNFVVCWTPGGEMVGGTGQALRCASSNGIKIYNLYHQLSHIQLKERIVEYHSGC